MSEQHLFTNRLEKAKALARAIYSGLDGEDTTPLEAVNATQVAIDHGLWWATVADAAQVPPPSQTTVSLVVDLVEFVEEVKEIEHERMSHAGRSTASG